MRRAGVSPTYALTEKVLEDTLGSLKLDSTGLSFPSISTTAVSYFRVTGFD